MADRLPGASLAPQELAAVLGVQSLMPQVFRSGLLLTATSDQELEAIKEKQIEEWRIASKASLNYMFSELYIYVVKHCCLKDKLCCRKRIGDCKSRPGD